ncbi:MAG: membrane protein insertion efficiency factor YidD [Desulfobacterales bacterium]|nr:membrane protein insertion efficiency factor YidD [Desulfobacterales bacterium]
MINPSRLDQRVALWLIRSYQLFISPLIGPACRFYPSCSSYAYQAIERYGFLRGAWLAGKRVLKCHPFHPGGVDPVP